MSLKFDQGTTYTIECNEPPLGSGATAVSDSGDPIAFDLDEVGLFPGVLNDTQIGYLYNSSSGRSREHFARMGVHELKNFQLAGS